MARKLGYGGVANTNGARDFSGKVESVSTGPPKFEGLRRHTGRLMRSIVFGAVAVKFLSWLDNIGPTLR